MNVYYSHLVLAVNRFCREKKSLRIRLAATNDSPHYANGQVTWMTAVYSGRGANAHR